MITHRYYLTRYYTYIIAVAPAAFEIVWHHDSPHPSKYFVFIISVSSFVNPSPR